MKKLFGLATILVMSLFLTGCGSTEKLTCTKSNEEDGIKTEEKYIVEADGKKAKYLEAEMKFTATTDEAALGLTFVESMFTEMVDEINAINGMTASGTLNEKVYTFKISADYDKVKPEDIADVDLDLADAEDFDINEFKKEYEDNGYTCK